MKEFKDKVAVITGAASGIGRGIAKRCLELGMKVVLSDINEKDLNNTENEMQALGGAILSVRTDVSKRNDVELLAEKTLALFGEVHLLFNNAGVGAGGPPWEATWSDWEWVIGVNLWGVIHGVKIFTPIMISQKTDCHIVNTSSIAGVMVGSTSAPYSVSKHAVVALSESLYLGLKERNTLVNVSVLCPSFVKTNIPNSERNRPVELHDANYEIHPQVKNYYDFLQTGVEKGMSTSQVADQVFEAIREEKFYILTHPECLAMAKLRAESLLRLDNPQDPEETMMKMLQTAT